MPEQSLCAPYRPGGGGGGVPSQVTDDSGTHSGPVSFLLGVGFGVRRTGAGPAASWVHPPSDADAAFHYGTAVGEAVTSAIAIALGVTEAGVGGVEAFAAAPTVVGAAPGLAAVGQGAALAGYGALGLVQAAQALQTARAVGKGGEETRNPTQDKKLTSGEIKRLKQAGHDPHELKEGDGTKDLFKTPEGDVRHHQTQKRQRAW